MKKLKIIWSNGDNQIINVTESYVEKLFGEDGLKRGFNEVISCGPLGALNFNHAREVVIVNEVSNEP